MGWLDHDRLGFNYRLSDIACALGIAQLEHLDDMLAAPLACRGAVRRGAGGHRRRRTAVPRRRRRPPVWFVYVVQLPREIDRDATIEALRARGIDSKPYLPAIHLMSFYRETFGHREGEFPVCEDIGRRSIALPFFPAMTESQVDRVATELREVVAVRQAL